MAYREPEARELTLGGLFGAAALALPVLFHLLSLGSYLLPMYLPLVTLAFLVSPGIAASTAFVVPLLSAVLTGMPPWYPPVAPAMAIELAIITAVAAAGWRWSRRSVLAVLIPTLLLGRLIQFALHYVMGIFLDLPPEFLSIASLVKTLPGVVLMIVVIPSLCRVIEVRGGETGGLSGGGKHARMAYFDSLADEWDEMVPCEDLVPRLRRWLRETAVDPGERVLDLGCGTGVLLGPLLELLGPAGEVEAVDFAPRMIERARSKHRDERVRFHMADVSALPLPHGQVDRAICFSAWPHFDDPDAVIAQLSRVVKPGGSVHVWHLDGREAINEIHRNAGKAVRGDRLEPAVDLARRFARQGFIVTEVADEPDAYRVTAMVGGAPS